VNIGAGTYNETLNIANPTSLNFDTGVTVDGINVTAASVGLAGTLNMTADLDIGANVNLIDDFTVNAGANDVTLANVTGTGGLNLNASAISLGDVNISGDQNYAGALSLNGGYSGASFNATGNTTLAGDTTIDTSAANGAIAFNGGIDGTVADAQNLTLNAGGGNIQLSDAGQNTRLGNMLVTAGEYDSSAGTINANNITLASTGNVNITANAVADATLSAQNITATLVADTIDITAVTTADINIIAGTTAKVTAGNILGSVTAPSADLTAQTSLNVDVNVGTLTVAAAAGNITGDIGELVIASPGFFSINGETTVGLTTTLGSDRNIFEPEFISANQPPAVGGSDTLIDIAFSGASAGNIYDASFTLADERMGSIQPSSDSDYLGSAQAAQYANDYMNDFWGGRRTSTKREERRKRQNDNND
ncbi:MAG: hypothetical protein MJA83_07500, partial [Gammaproteobacteria bacterium]|nr:hypothetical protein [Gammaproteobacteria bacterium]